jgi:thymidine kinase
VDDLKLHVYLFGLDSDFNRNTFGHTLKLIPFCDKVEKLSAICMKCKNGNMAIFTMIKPNILSMGTDDCESQVLIGSDDKYIPVCRKCYLENN